MEILLAVIAAVAVLGAVVNVAMKRSERQLTERPNGRAIQRAVNEVGRYDGSAQAARKAREVFLDLAENGPYDLVGSNWTVPELADGFVSNLNPSSGPILIEAAYSVIGAYRFSTRGPDTRTRDERQEDLYAESLIAAIYGDWVKDQNKKYKVVAPSEVAEQRRRLGLMTWLLLDRCERLGYLA